MQPNGLKLRTHVLAVRLELTADYPTWKPLGSSTLPKREDPRASVDCLKFSSHTKSCFVHWYDTAGLTCSAVTCSAVTCTLEFGTKFAPRHLRRILLCCLAEGCAVQAMQQPHNKVCGLDDASHKNYSRQSSAEENGTKVHGKLLRIQNIYVKGSKQ